MGLATATPASGSIQTAASSSFRCLLVSPTRTIGQSRAIAASELRDASLASDYRAVNVQSSWTDLEAAQDALDERLQRFIEEQLVQTSIDPRTNAVVLHVAEIVSASQRAQIEGLSHSSPVAVELRELPAEHFEVAPRACDAAHRMCGLPMRGGVGIFPPEYSSSYVCTSAFRALGNTDGKRYVLTAGHCVKLEGTVYWPWVTRDNALAQKSIGTLNQWWYPGHDWAKIDATGSWANASSWPAMVAYWGVNHEYPIKGEASSFVNQVVCHSGKTTGGSCGTVRNKNVTATYGSDGKITDLTVIKGPNFCAWYGDSGSPYFSGNMAIGIESGGPTEAPECGEENYGMFVEVTQATAALNVHIPAEVPPLPPPPPPPAPPTVQVQAPTGLTETQATMNGTVNPNGSETTYRFEYGKTTGYGNSAPIPDAGAGAGVNAVPISIPVNLLPRTRYHYRVVASNAGGTSYSGDQAFTTGVKWSVRNSNSAGNPDASFWFGIPGEKRVVGDWDGNGTQTPGVFNPSTGVWKLRNNNTTGPAHATFQYGGGVWKNPVVGDWDNNGTDTIGVYDPATGNWNLRDSNSAGPPKYSFQYGGGPWTNSVSGDWNGNGTDTIGVYDPVTGNWNLRDSNSAGPPNYSFQYGGGPWTTSLTGDWDANGTDTIGVFDPTAGNWSLRNSNSGGPPSYSFQHGGSQFAPVVGDWDNNGTMTAGLTHSNAPTAVEWGLRNSNSGGNPDIALEFGSPEPEQVQVTGDWDGNGTVTIGRYEPITGIWRLRNSNSTGSTEIEFQYGGSQFKPVTGDWNGDGITTIGLYEPIAGKWNLRNTNGSGNPDVSFQYGGGVWSNPVTGDWDKNGTDTIGVYDPVPGNWNLRNTNGSGNPDISFQYGGGVWTGSITGDWNGDGTDTIGVYDPTAGNWNLRDLNSGGPPTYAFQHGGSQFRPVAGDWDADGDDTVGLVTW